MIVRGVPSEVHCGASRFRARTCGAPPCQLAYRIRPSHHHASLFVLITASARARRLAPTRQPFMFASGYNGDDLHDAYRDVAVLQQLYDIAEFKAALAISLMEDDG